MSLSYLALSKTGWWDPPGDAGFSKEEVSIQKRFWVRLDKSLVSDLGLNRDCHLICSVYQFCSPCAGGFQVPNGMSLNEELGREAESAHGLSP